MIDVAERPVEARSGTETAESTVTVSVPAERAEAIVVDGVWKSYQRQTRQISLRHEALKLLSRPWRGTEPAASDTFWALQDISFTVRAGESVALVGRNGSGKTTLLRVLCGITRPSRGVTAVHGRFATLIALGAGFNLERTGRENIFLNAAIQGMNPRRTAELLDDIIAFSELGDFIDTPVKRYSSGMVTRLGFSIAAHIFPDIIFIDEVLAVGDAAFQQKCVERIMALKAEGRTIVFVSHSDDLVRRLCDRAIWLHRGKLRLDGPADRVLEAYESMLGIDEDAGRGLGTSPFQPDIGGGETGAATDGQGMGTLARRALSRNGRPATLIADPNPVPPDGPSGTTIRWDTGDGLVGQVYQSWDGGKEFLFAQGASGEQEAPWLAPGSVYAFTLYAGTKRASQLGSVTVTRPAPIPIGDATPSTPNHDGNHQPGDGEGAQ